MTQLVRGSVVIVLLILMCVSTSKAITLYTYTNGGSNGPWNVAGTWTTDPTGVTLTGSAVPANGDAVVILNGFTVNLTANVATTGLSVTINAGGTLNLATFTMATINSLSGGGLMRIQAGYFPVITTNNFALSNAAGATVEYYNFTGTVPTGINYPNLVFSNNTASAFTITVANTATYAFGVGGNFSTRSTGGGLLTVTLGSQASRVITLAVSGNVSIGANTILRVGVFAITHVMQVYGDMTVDGAVDFSNGTAFTASATSSGAATLSFLGATNNTLACNGVVDILSLTVDKGSSSTNILSVTSTDVANFNLYATGQLLYITNGTLRLGSNITVPRMYGASSTNYDVGGTGSSPMFWVDGATVNTASSALVVYGKFRITAGSFTTTGGEGSVIREEGQYIIEGGTFITEKFRPSTTASTHRGSFTMTGGTFNTSGTGSSSDYARFSLPYPEQVFIMSGGTINVNNPQSGGGANNGGIHIGCKASNYIVTGGTFNAILSGGASFFNISSTAPFYDLNISKTGGTPATVQLNGIGSVSGTITAAQPLVVLNDLTITGTNSPVLNANVQDVTVGRNFTINTGGTFTPNATTTTFNGAASQIFTNDGTITSGLYNFTVDKPAGTLTLAGIATQFQVRRMLTINGGVLNDGGKVISAEGNIYNKSIHTGTGSITLAGTATQTIDGDGNGVFGNLILNNTSTPGAVVVADLSISNSLTLAGNSRSLFDISQYQLSFTSPSATALAVTGNDFSSDKMIRTSGFQSDRGVRKTFGNLAAFTFAFGVGTSYTPAIIQLTAAPTTYGTITARPVNSRHQFVVAGNTNNLTWYWKVVSSGFTGVGASAVSHTYRYVESSVSPANDDANYVPARYNPTTWTVINNTAQVDEVDNRIFFTNVGYIDGDYTAGIPSAFGIVQIFYSKRNGNWNDTGAGTTPWSNISHSGPDATSAPGPGDQVFIGDGGAFNHSILITINGQSSGGLEINAGSTLDVGVYTGHNFGRLENVPISGSGLLRISSASAIAEFPAGDFGNFIRANGGTVQYYTTGAQDFEIPKNSIAPTVLPLISYKNLLISPANNRYIAMPDQDEHIYGNMIVQGATAADVVRLNAVASRTLLINGNLQITGGNLQFRNGTAQALQVDGNVSVGAGTTFNLASTGGAAVNTLIIAGNLVNNGTFDMSNTASYVCNTTFTGTANTTITGTGSTTDFNILTVSKGTSQTPVLDVNTAAFTLSGGALPLVLTNGTFRLSSAQTVTIANGADFNVPATTRLSANGGTMQITGADGVDLLLSGTLEILAGTVDVGTTANENTIEYAATGQPTIIASGGALNVRAQVRRSVSSSQGALIYNQSGSSVVSIGITNASALTRGVLEFLNPGSSFTMSGGTLRMVRGSGSTSIADLYLQPASFSVTGGTIEIGTGATTQTVDINTGIPLYNLSVTGTTNTARLELNPLTLRGTLNIGSTTVFNASTFNVNIAGDFINANINSATGTTVGGFQAGSLTQTTTFNSATANQSLTGVSGNLTNFANLVISNTFAGGVVSLSTNTNLRVNGSLTMSSGTVAGGANVITAISSVFNSTTQTNTAGGSVTLNGTGSQFIGGNGNGKFGNVILDNAAGASFGANQEITGTLTFTNGALTIGIYSLNLSNTSLAAIVNATNTKYIITSGRLSDGGVTKAFAGSLAAGNFVFPIGVSGKYTPASYTLTIGTTGGNVTIKPVNSKHPSATGPGTAYIRYYWSVNHTIANLISITHTYTYVAADQNGTAADYRDARFIGGAWTVGITAGNPDITNRIIQFTNTDANGDYTAGEATAFVNPTTYTSIATGNWEADDTVWDIDPPGTNLGPPPGSFVIISEGHTVTVTASAKTMATLEVRGLLALGTTTGHNFGTVSTSGASFRTIQIQSSTFPSGDFTSFTATNGGTIEYNGAMTLPTQAIYNNLSFSGAGIKTLSSVDLAINGSVAIAAGTVTNAANKDITLSSATGDFTNNGTFLSGSGKIQVGRNLLNTGAGASFTAGSGLNGLIVGGNLVNSAAATFIASSDSIGVRGSLTNSATFTASGGALRITGSLNNTAGTFTASSGIVSLGGSLVNNGAYTAGTGATTVRGSFTNSGAGATYQANGNALSITGSFTNSASATLNAGTGTITVGGDWTNSGTFNAGTGSVTFNGAGTQTLTGATNFYNASRTNGGGLVLNNNINIASILTLTSGIVTTGTNVVSLTNTATQPVTGSATSYINGRASISYPNAAGTTRVYPIGKGGAYRPVTIRQAAASTSPVVRVEAINTPPSGTFPSTIEGLSQARYYSIDLLSGTMNSPTVELSFNTNPPADESVTVPGNVRIVRSGAPTGPWTDEGGSGVFSPAAPAGYATSGITSIAATTFFALGSNNQTLPITLLSFTGRVVQDGVELNWTTATEIENDFFTIERSINGIDFVPIDTLAGAGDSKVKLSYSAIDHDPVIGISYYRLKQTDFDNRYSYSPNIVRIEFRYDNKSSMIVYPNPSALHGETLVRVESGRERSVLITLTDASGRVYFMNDVALNERFEFDLNSLPVTARLSSGVYFITAQAGSFRDTKKIVLK